jgi:glycosyltransferase involved in cell wall biosynthesis
MPSRKKFNDVLVKIRYFQSHSRMHKKILVVTDNLRTQINGVVTTFKNIESLAMADGFDIVYIDPGQFPHCDAPGYPEVKLSWPRGIGKKIQALDPDHIHIATEGPLGLAARLYCDSRGLKYNTSYHTKFPEFLKKMYHVPESLTYAYMRWFHKHSGRVLTTTQTMVDDLRRHGFYCDIRAWTRGVDRDIFTSSLRKEKLTGRPILLSVGRVSKEKGLDDFCRLDYPGATKVVVGDGPYKAELERKYPDVCFVGAKTGVELAEYFASADVFVFTSRTDTFGVVIIESLAVGTPVAAYPVPGPVDILENGITGHMSEDLKASIDVCLGLSRDRIEQTSLKWTWAQCWEIFKKNLIRNTAY